jgi:hypothetical protein
VPGADRISRLTGEAIHVEQVGAAQARIVLGKDNLATEFYGAGLATLVSILLYRHYDDPAPVAAMG